MSIWHEGTFEFLGGVGCLTVVCVGALGLVYLFAPKNPAPRVAEPTPITAPLRDSGSAVDATPLPTATYPPSITAAPVAENGIYYAPGNITYPFAEDPESAGRTCVSIPGGGTVMEAAVVVGPDSHTYPDTPVINVFDGNGSWMGSFPTSAMPPNDFRVVSKGTIVCP